MKEYTLETKSRYATVTNSVNPITGNDIVLVGVFSKISGRLLATYDVSEHTPFESFSALLKFAKASQLDTPSHPSHDLPSDDSLGGVSPSSPVELHPSNDVLPGDSSPVAASSYPATSDTLNSNNNLKTVFLTDAQCFLIRVVMGLEWGKVPHSPLRQLIDALPVDLNPNLKAGLTTQEADISQVYSALDQSVLDRVLVGSSVHKYWDR